MATTTFDALPDNSTDANFRAWGSALSAALASIGWVKTSDTGQIDWTTVSKPASSNTISGKEMWRLDDTLQTTAPILIKVSYGSDISYQASPGVTVQIGSSTDGACGFLGNSSDITFVHRGSYYDTTNVARSYVSGDVGGGVVAMFLDSPTSGKNNSQMFFSVERTRDSSGAPTVDGALLLSHTSGQSPTASLFWAAGGNPTKESTYWSFLLPVSSTSSAWNNKVTVSPVYACWGQALPAGYNVLIYKDLDFVNGELFVADLYGVPHTFRALGSNFTSFSYGYAGLPRLAILWE